MQVTSNSQAFIEAEQYSSFILNNLHDGLLPQTFYRNVSDFGSGTTLHIKTVGSVTIQEAAEDTPLVYNPIESGEVSLQITNYVGDAWYVTDDLREDGAMIEQLMAGLAQASRSKGLVPEASEKTLRAFSVSEMKLYNHATTHKYVICQVYIIHIPLCRYKYVTHIEV